MATITTTTAPGPITIDSPYRITVDQYERMIEAGILIDGDKVELIDGILVSKMGKSAAHNSTSKKILRAIDRLLPDGWTWRQEQSIRIPDFNEPEPDFVVLRGADEDYEERNPGPADAALVIEVSLTLLGDDRGRKLAAYAGAGIPVYWIVNLKEQKIEVYSAPGLSAYESRADHLPGQLVPLVIDGQEMGQIAVDDMLPRSGSKPS